MEPQWWQLIRSPVNMVTPVSGKGAGVGRDVGGAEPIVGPDKFKNSLSVRQWIMLVLWSHEYWVDVKDNLPGPLLLGIKSRGNSSAWTKPALRPVFSVCLCGKKNLTSELFSCESWAGSKVGWSWWKDSCCLQRICDGYFALSRKGSSPLLLSLWSGCCCNGKPN